jgi:hypothetical protein
MQQAGVVKVGEAFKKNKASERANSGVPPEESTHLSDAADTLLWGTQRAKIQSQSGGDFVDVVFSTQSE